MKKLTAGIFATILGVTAMGAADAAVTSKGYVDAAVGTVAQSVTDLGTTVSNTYATKDALTSETNARTSADNTLQGNINTLAGTVGTLPEGQSTVVGYIESKTANIASDETVRALTGRVTTAEGEIDVLQEKTEGLGSAAYKDATDFADATATAQALQVKANAGDVEATYAKKTEISDMATMTWVEGKDYATNTALTTGLSGKQANLSDTQLQAVNSGITADKISAMDQATADAQAAADAAQVDANTNAADIVNLKAADATFELKANVSGAAETTTGKYVLTKIDDGQGNVSFGWELIDRDYTVGDSTPNGQ